MEALKREIALADAEIASLLAELEINPAQCDFLWQCPGCQTVNLATLQQKVCFVCRTENTAPKAAPKPVIEAPKPVIEAPKPVIEAPKPAAAPKPVIEAPKPVTEAPKPVAAPKPAVEVLKSLVEAPKPLVVVASKFYAPAVFGTPDANTNNCPSCFATLSTNEVCATCCSDTGPASFYPCPACTHPKLSLVGPCPVCYYELGTSSQCQSCHSPLAAGQAWCEVCYFVPSQDAELVAWKCQACQTLNSQLDSTVCSVCFADCATVALLPPTTVGVCPACTSSKPLHGECNVCGLHDDSNVCHACTSRLEPNQTTCPVCFYAGPNNALQPTLLLGNNASTVLDLSLDGKRESLSGARAHELLAALAHPGVQSVRLSSKSFGRDASLVAAKHLAAMDQVEHANLSDIIAGRPTDEALEVLRVMCTSLNPATLKSIDLSDNALGERAIRVLSGFWQSIAGTVESISLRNDGLSELSISLLVDLLKPSAGHLQALHFESNMSGDGGAKFLDPLFTQLAKFPTLPFDFSMVSCRVRSQGSASLNLSLGQISHRLNSLDLSDCAMGEIGSQALVKLLADAPNLTKLLLKDTGIIKSQLPHVIECLRNMPKLQVLDLGVLEMSTSDMDLLFSVLNANADSQLESLNLAENCGKAKGIAGLFVSSKSLPKLKSFDLSMNQLNDAAAGMILGRIAGRKLEHVELNGNSFTAGVVEVLQVKFQGVLGALDENEEP
ncbi:hypothetical protein BASA81_000517 [Batrachochytrium salamandrivorans]|nr:hypothetical protein BASA81_000517 [Batrachochytrium salamandrivorans]